MDGPFYVDSRAPFLAADVPAVTLATTNKALIPVANIPVFGSNYFAWTGKAIRMRLFGRITTGATPGNGQFSLYWGSGVDATGTIIASSATFALTASQTSLSWEAQCIVRCRTPGPAAVGSLFVTGYFEANPGVVASTLQPILIPASVPAAVVVDLTVANVLSPQFLRSGSTAESMQVHDVSYEALN